VTFWYGSGCESGSSNPYLWLADPDADPGSPKLRIRVRIRIRNTEKISKLLNLKKVLEEGSIVDILLLAPALLQEDRQELKRCSHGASLIPEQVFLTSRYIQEGIAQCRDGNTVPYVRGIWQTIALGLIC
jgi:hypothetical protein